MIIPRTRTATVSRSGVSRTHDQAASHSPLTSGFAFVPVLLITLDSSLLLFVLAIYRFSNVERPASLLRSVPAFLCVGAALIMAAAALGLVRHLQGLTRSLRRQAILTIFMNYAALLLLVASGEVMLRLVHRISVRRPGWNIHLPALRNWGETSAEFRAALDKSDHAHAYHEPDSLLGWNIGKSRRSEDGLYASSVEGLRSAKQGDVLLTWSRSDPVGLSHPKPYRVALIGDSFTFGYEVAYDETWAHLIGPELGKDFQALNFGVIGYSVNQIRLKYERDVKPTHPDVVVLSVISHDFIRDGYLYNFMPFPDMLSLPYARPRAVVRDGRLTLVNTPIMTPREIFAAEDVHELPYLQYDMAYDRFEWETNSWQLPQRSFLFRFLTSWPPLPSLAQQKAADADIDQLGRQIVASLLDSIRGEGTRVVVVYFPDQFELDPTNTHPPHHAMLAPRIFRELGVDYVDATPCIQGVEPGRRFGRTHYSAESHAALSKCLPKMILSHVF